MLGWVCVGVNGAQIFSKYCWVMMNSHQRGVLEIFNNCFGSSFTQLFKLITELHNDLENREIGKSAITC